LLKTVDGTLATKPGEAGWLGTQREHDIAFLQGEMKHARDGKERVLLAREARRIRHGPDKVTFGIGMADLVRLSPIGVH
jgi:hypothetical protein